MKLGYILLFALTIISLTVTAQKEIVVGSKEYDQAKIAGTLDKFTLVYDINSFHPIESKPYKPTKPTTSHGSDKSGVCDCYVEPDATYISPPIIGTLDDGSSALINIPFSFNFYGQTYTSMYININGNITFANPMSTFSPTAFPSTGPKIIAPFWGDVDLRGGLGQLVYKITPNAVFINWEDVGYYDTHGDLRNTFQLIISDGTDPSIPDGNNVAFCYQDMQWTTGDASNGENGFPDLTTPPFYYATCGTNKGDNISFFQLAQFGHPGTDFDGSMGNDDGISWLDNKSFFIDVSNSVNIPPIAEGVSACDTFKVCAFGDTADISINFFAPEAGQTTTITYTNGGLASLQEIANIPGNTAQLVLRVIGSVADQGTYNLTVTASDDFAPTPGVTSMNFVIVIQDDPNFTLDPILQYTTACDSFQVSVLNGPYDTYLWDNLSHYPTTYITETGNFGVTVSLDQCYKRVDSIIYVPEPADFNLIGNLYLCPGEDSTFVQIGDSLAIDLIDWHLPNPILNAQFHNWLTPGNYHLTNMDSTGLCTNDTLFSIFMASPAHLFGDTVSCFGLNFQSSGVILGTDSHWSSPDPQITFSNPNIANPIITASTYGIYTVNFATPCAADLTAQIIFPFAPTIFNDTTVCGTQFTIPLDQITTFGPSTWSLTQPNSGSFSPDYTENATTFTAASVPYQFQMSLKDNFCPNLKDVVTVLMVALPAANAPDVSCFYNETGITASSYLNGGTWSVLDNPNTPYLESDSLSFINGTAATDENPDVQVTIAGTYTLVYNDPFCGISLTEILTFPPYVYTQAYDTTLCAGVAYDLHAYEGPAPISYSWNTGQVGPVITVTEPGTYIVTASNECHSYTDSAVIDYYVCDIQAPNVISLSSHSGNNFWYVNGSGIEDFECFIVNRWGNLIYEYNDVNSGWNGQDKSGNIVEEGVYFYHIKAKSIGGQDLEKQGFITVVH